MLNSVSVAQALLDQEATLERMEMMVSPDPTGPLVQLVIGEFSTKL